MREVIEELVDSESFMEVHLLSLPKTWWWGFARLAGRSIGIVANQPAYLAGGPGYSR